MLIDDDLIELNVGYKSIPPTFWGRTAGEVAAERHALSEFPTPLMTFDRAASDFNVRILLDWARSLGLEIAPHGKTSMAPTLWHRLLDAGAWGITVATPWQAQVARAAGIPRVLLANEVIDPVGAAWLARETDAGFEIASWVDSVEAVAVLGRTAGSRPIDVLVELGGNGGRAGARGITAALSVARAAAAEPRVRLRGVSGYEGTYGSDRSEPSRDRVRAYLTEVRELMGEVGAAGLIEGPPIVTAGGSTWFDVVAEVLGPLRHDATVILRSGAFQAHDDVLYEGISPFAGTDHSLRAALTLWSRVVSRPEPTLAIIDAGNRDAPFDKGLPVPLDLPGARLTALNDQHGFLEIPADSDLAVGDVLRLGISHPCTAFDRWRLLPEVDDATIDDPRVVGFIRTWF